jgi:hypothetical protein
MIAAEEIVDLIDSNEKIRAIKRIRELTGLGLKDAKDVADAAQGKAGWQNRVNYVTDTLNANAEVTSKVVVSHVDIFVHGTPALQVTRAGNLIRVTRTDQGLSSILIPVSLVDSVKNALDVLKDS